MNCREAIENRKRNLSGGEFCANKLFEPQERSSFSTCYCLEIYIKIVNNMHGYKCKGDTNEAFYCIREE